MSSIAQLSPDLGVWNPPAKIPAVFANPFPRNMATGGFQQQQIGASELAVPQGQSLWVGNLEKPLAREGNLSVILAHSHDLWRSSITNLSADISSIKAEYVLRNEPAIVDFFSTHRTVSPFLSRAFPELKRAFGENVVFNLEVLPDYNDLSTLYAKAIWRGPAEEANAALEDFDQRWWLNQSPQSAVTFTYELS